VEEGKMMEFKDSNVFTCDVLVVGGGGAGLRAAIEARAMGADVLVVSKSRVGYANNTYISKASISATGWGDPRDDQGVHLRDTLIGGRYLNDEQLVAVMAREVRAQVNFLEKCGVNFAKKAGHIQLGHVPGHSHPRQVRGEGRTGRDIILPLRRHARRIGVRFAERVFISKLLLCENRIAGASGICKDSGYQIFVANCVILASGGFSQIYLHTNNAPGITGDGQALAFEVGLPLKDMEFVQFYPTALGKHGTRILLYEAFILDAGAVLKNAKGENIIDKHGLSDPMVITRDRLAQAIMQDIREGLDVDGGVIMDLSPISDAKAERLSHLLPSGWSASKEEFIVSPTAHFCMGGVITDKDTETTIPGLFASGEVCAGIHGANRLGGNALAEVFSLGGIAGRKAALRAREIGPPEIPKGELAEERDRLKSILSRSGRDVKTSRRSLKEVMWAKAGIVRQKRELEEAMGAIEELKFTSLKPCSAKPGDLIKHLELQNMLLLSEMVCRAALLRTESRGSHHRRDFPEEDNANWLKNIVIRKKETGMRLESVPVSLDKVIDP
jgi:succinate dehydrogenase/fumarate reductase flavoprotein subunit